MVSVVGLDDLDIERSILEAVSDAMMITDSSSKILHANKQVSMLLQMPQKLIEQSYFYDLFSIETLPEPPVFFRYMRRFQKAGKWIRQIEMINIAGVSLHLEISISLCYRYSAHCYIIVLKDLIDQDLLIKEQQVSRLLEQKNKEITDSIRYAFQIQMAVLPDKRLIDKHLSNYFIFYKPKDIVSGDFYWFAHRQGSVIIAAVDCTGHGVPGAFMSLLGYTTLNKIVNEFGITEPDIILETLDENVSQMLQKNPGNTEQLEGMDIALCKIDFLKREIVFAGAGRPLYLVRNGNLEIIAPDRYSAGSPNYNSCSRTFIAHRFPLQRGDSLYMFTDGFTDQFGGPNNKKFTPKQLRELIMSLQGLHMSQQEVMFKQEFELWQGHNSLTDDVMLIGISI